MLCCTIIKDKVTTFSVAIGGNIAVNLLIGVSFIRSAGMIINTVDHIIENKNLNSLPFYMIYHTLQCGLLLFIPAYDTDTDDQVLISNISQQTKDTQLIFVET